MSCRDGSRRVAYCLRAASVARRSRFSGCWADHGPFQKAARSSVRDDSVEPPEVGDSLQLTFAHILEG